MSKGLFQVLKVTKILIKAEKLHFNQLPISFLGFFLLFFPLLVIGTNLGASDNLPFLSSNEVDVLVMVFVKLRS